ncbi:MAG: hypothetical protein EBX41_07515 [Chitinophagia bacterium]|nr:hypothetical protein [Chitinophagia bacterium]
MWIKIIAIFLSISAHFKNYTRTGIKMSCPFKPQATEFSLAEKDKFRDANFEFELFRRFEINIT